jgi:hypothetical protein
MGTSNAKHLPVLPNIPKRATLRFVCFEKLMTIFVQAFFKKGPQNVHKICA